MSKKIVLKQTLGVFGDTPFHVLPEDIPMPVVSGEFTFPAEFLTTKEAKLDTKAIEEAARQRMAKMEADLLAGMVSNGPVGIWANGGATVSEITAEQIIKACDEAKALQAVHDQTIRELCEKIGVPYRVFGVKPLIEEEPMTDLLEDDADTPLIIDMKGGQSDDANANG